MTLFAHAGHWIAQLLYLAPVIAMVGAILWARLKARKRRGGSEWQPAAEPRRVDQVSAGGFGKPPAQDIHK